MSHLTFLTEDGRAKIGFVAAVIGNDNSMTGEFCRCLIPSAP